jgi:hypothetical protein
VKRFTLILATTTLLIATSCGQKEEVLAPEPTSTITPFTPASSGQVTPLQVKFWLASNAPLDSLASKNSEALNSKDSLEYRSAFEFYISNREAVCKTNGLSGGYTEYLWVSKNISQAINRPLLDSLKIQTL